jgi:hypothetical protein
MAKATRHKPQPTPPPVEIMLVMNELEATALRVLLGGQRCGQDSEIGRALGNVWEELKKVTVTDKYSNHVFDFDFGFKVKDGATI